MSLVRKLLPPILFFGTLATAIYSVISYFGSVEKVLDAMKTVEPTFVNGVYAVLGLSILIVCCLPSSPFEMTFGFVFGWWGCIICPLALTLGSVLSFFVARTPFFASIGQKLQKNEKIMLFSRVLDREMFTYLFLSRIAQFPIFLKNYGFAILPQVRLPIFTLSVFLASCPMCAVWVYIGVLTRDFAEGAPASPGANIAKGASGVLGIISLVYIGMRAWKGVQEEGERMKAEQAAAGGELAGAAEDNDSQPLIEKETRQRNSGVTGSYGAASPQRGGELNTGLLNY